MDSRRPGPVNPPVPEHIVTMAVKLDDSQFQGDDNFMLPAHHLVFFLPDKSTVVVDMALVDEIEGCTVAGVTLDLQEIARDHPEFSVAVGGAVTIVANCDDDDFHGAMPGHTVYWKQARDTAGFTTAPLTLRTLQMQAYPFNVPVVPVKVLKQVDPFFAASYNTPGTWRLGDTRVDSETAMQSNPLWNLATHYNLGGRIGLLLAKGGGDAQQHECRVLLNL